MKKFTVVCGEFDTEAEAKVLSDILCGMGIKAAVTEKGGDPSDLTGVLLRIVEELQKSNEMQAKMTEIVTRKPLDISKMKTENTPEPEHKLWDAEKAKEALDKPLCDMKRPARSLGDLIRSYRIAKKMSQIELAKKIGVNQHTICNYERGKAITKPIFIKMLEPLEIPMDVIQPYLNDFKGDVYHA